MPKSLVEFIEAVSDDPTSINKQQLVQLIMTTNNPKQLQSHLLDDFGCDVLLRDCVLMIKLRDLPGGRLSMATTANPNDPPEATMKY